MTIEPHKIIGRLRKQSYLSEQEISDEDLLKATEGTLWRAGIELGYALDEFKNVVKEEIINIIRKIKGVLGK